MSHYESVLLSLAVYHNASLIIIILRILNVQVKIYHTLHWLIL